MNPGSLADARLTRTHTLSRDCGSDRYLPVPVRYTRSLGVTATAAMGRLILSSPSQGSRMLELHSPAKASEAFRQSLRSRKASVMQRSVGGRPQQRSSACKGAGRRMSSAGPRAEGSSCAEPLSLPTPTRRLSHPLTSAQLAASVCMPTSCPFHPAKLMSSGALV